VPGEKGVEGNEKEQNSDQVYDPFRFRRIALVEKIDSDVSIASHGVGETKNQSHREQVPKGIFKHGEALAKNVPQEYLSDDGD
jgi:hypothetical protein